MTATDIALLSDKQIETMSFEQLDRLRRAANQAYATVGDHPKYNTEDGQNLLKHAAEVADRTLKLWFG